LQPAKFNAAAAVADRTPPADFSHVGSEKTNPPSETEVREVGFNPTPAARPTLTEVEMLRIQLGAFDQVIRKLQDELARREKSQADSDKVLESLRREVDSLRGQLEASKRDETR